MTYSPIDLVENFIRRFVSYPSEHACVAHALWIAHCHFMDLWELDAETGVYERRESKRQDARA